MELKDICFFTVGCGGSYADMAQGMLRSYNENTQKPCDFVAFTDKSIAGAAQNIIVPRFHHDNYFFKLEYLAEISKFNYKFFIWIDTDSYFVRDIDEQRLLKLCSYPCFCLFENNLSDERFYNDKKWWGVPVEDIYSVAKSLGDSKKNFFSINAGFWGVNRESVENFISTSNVYRKYFLAENKNITEEPSLAFASQVLLTEEQIEDCLILNNSELYGGDWRGFYRDDLPDGKGFYFSDWFTDEKTFVNPSIIHSFSLKDKIVEYGKSIIK